MLSISASSGRTELSAPLRPFTVPTASTVRRCGHRALRMNTVPVRLPRGGPHGPRYRDEYFENHFVISLEKLSLMLPPDFIENPKSYN